MGARDALIAAKTYFAQRTGQISMGRIEQLDAASQSQEAPS